MMERVGGGGSGMEEEGSGGSLTGLESASGCGTGDKRKLLEQEQPLVPGGLNTFLHSATPCPTQASLRELPSSPPKH